jgi:CheY-like chemotaxis protein
VVHVLLVEDKNFDRELIREALEQRGARVTVACSDIEAYALLNADKLGSVDLMLTDINLGLGTTGFDVARAARGVRPDISVAYMTAYRIETDPHAVPGSITLRKSLRLSDLVEQALDFASGRQDNSPRYARSDQGSSAEG